jgi:hypothetical protein
LRPLGGLGRYAEDWVKVKSEATGNPALTPVNPDFYRPLLFLMMMMMMMMMMTCKTHVS